MAEVETPEDAPKDGRRPEEALLCNAHLSDILDPESYAGDLVMAYMQGRLLVRPCPAPLSLLCPTERVSSHIITSSQHHTVTSSHRYIK
jgi:hypothetical protein